MIQPLVLSVRVTVIAEPDCATENVSGQVSLPYQLSLLTLDGHVFVVPISMIIFDPVKILLPTVTSVHPETRRAAREYQSTR